MEVEEKEEQNARLGRPALLAGLKLKKKRAALRQPGRPPLVTTPRPRSQPLPLAWFLLSLSSRIIDRCDMMRAHSTSGH